jgi:DNA-binding NtrC family response regulator
MAHDILIVDDEADIRLLIAGILRDEGYHTREATNSDGTLEAIRARRPTLVVLDIWLQGSTRAPGPAGGDDQRAWQHRDRGAVDQARRL